MTQPSKTHKIAIKRTRKTPIKPTLLQWVIPSVHNNFHPRILRPLGLTIIALVIAFIPTFYNVAAAHRLQVLGYAANITVGDLYSLTNQERANAGIASLNLNDQLNQAAYNKARDMFANNYWAHNSPSGATPWSFINGAGYSYNTAGENLAKDFNTSAGVMYGWMNSPEHRANILNTTYQDVGMAVMNGTLLGSETTLVVAMYASPYVAPTPPPAPATTHAAPTPPAASTPAPQAQPSTPATPAPTTSTNSTAPVSTTPKATSTSIKTSQKSATLPPQSTPQNSEAVKGIMTVAPVRAYASLNWGQKASLFILCALALLFVMKHTIIWRTRRRGWKHIWLRAHPIAQGGILAVAVVMMLVSGTGSIL